MNKKRKNSIMQSLPYLILVIVICSVLFVYSGGKSSVHDLKTGATPASFKQLEIYAALFCLEYRVDPLKIQYELRIYQNDDVLVENPTGIEIEQIMQKIIFQ